MNFRRLRTGLGLVAFLLVATAGAGVAQFGPNPNAPPPPPLPNVNRNATSQSTSGPITPQPTLAPNALESIVPSGLQPAAGPALTPAPGPSPSPSAAPKRGKKPATGTPAPEPSETPAPPQFSSLDGIWEIELQPIGQRLAKYEHLSIVQNGSSLSGYWEHLPGRTRTPITGSFDGRLIQITATSPTANAIFSGYVENMGDMVGIKRVSEKDPGTAFTGQHRKKEKT